MSIGKRAAAVLYSLRVGPHEEAAFDFEFRCDNPGDGDVVPWALGRLERQVGGTDRLDALDAEPLPDEAFQWAGIPDDIGDRVHEVLHLVDTCCDRGSTRNIAPRADGYSPAFRRRGLMYSATM